MGALERYEPQGEAPREAIERHAQRKPAPRLLRLLWWLGLRERVRVFDFKCDDCGEIHAVAVEAA